MTIEIEEDLSRGGGYAILRTRASKGPPTLDLKFRRLAEDRPYLGPEGWQNKQTSLTVTGVVYDSGGAKIPLGPQICDHIEPDAQVDLEIPQLEVNETVFWPANMQPSVRPGSPGRPVGQATGDHAERVDDQNSEERIGSDQTNEQSVTGEGASGSHHNEDSLPEPSVEPGDPGNRAVLFIAALVALLIVMVAAAWFVFGRDEPAAPHVLPDNDEAGQPDQGQGGAPSAEPDIDPRQRALEMIRNGEPPAALVQEARRMLDDGHAEASFLLFDHAQRQGSADALMQLGYWYDPSREGIEQLDPDPAIAARYYERAGDAGAEGSADAVRSLCQHIRNGGEGADTPSGRLLLRDPACQ